MRVVRLVDEEPGQERAERQRQPGRLGDRRGPETQGERHEQQELVVPHPRHSRQDLGQDARGEIEERHQDRGRRQESPRDREDPVALHRAEGRDQDDQDDCRQILDERDPDHDPAVPAVELAAIEEQPGQHHRARGGHDHADDRAGDRAPAEQAPDGEPDGRRQDDADRAADERDPLHAHQVLQREFDPEREHQQHDADLREQLERVDVGDRRPGGQGADEKTADDVAENQRLAGEPGERSAEHRGDEDIRQIPEEDGIRAHVALTAT